MAVEDGVSLEHALGQDLLSEEKCDGILRGKYRSLSCAAPFLLHVVLDVGSRRFFGRDAVQRLAYWDLLDFRAMRSPLKHPFAVQLPRKGFPFLRFYQSSATVARMLENMKMPVAKWATDVSYPGRPPWMASPLSLLWCIGITFRS